MNCSNCGQELPKENIVEKTERRMKEYMDWTWNKLSNPDLQRLSWDVKNRGFYTYADRNK